jgi:hypothetical protein
VREANSKRSLPRLLSPLLSPLSLLPFPVQHSSLSSSRVRFLQLFVQLSPRLPQPLSVTEHGLALAPELNLACIDRNSSAYLQQSPVCPGQAYALVFELSPKTRAAGGAQDALATFTLALGSPAPSPACALAPPGPTEDAPPQRRVRQAWRLAGLAGPTPAEVKATASLPPHGLPALITSRLSLAACRHRGCSGALSGRGGRCGA